MKRMHQAITRLTRATQTALVLPAVREAAQEWREVRQVIEEDERWMRDASERLRSLRVREHLEEINALTYADAAPAGLAA